MIRPANATLLERLVPFVVAPKEHLSYFDLSPLGVTIERCFDPLRTDSKTFLDRLERLDALTFGDEDMPMPRWLFFDGAELPAGIVGLARECRDMSDAGRALFGLRPGDDGLVPYAMYIAIPTHEPGVWMGHNLASIGPKLPEEGLSGLGSLTKALALAAYPCRHQIGATQWSSRALFVHARLGPLDLLTAWTPAHSNPSTLTYRATLTREALLHLARDPSGRIDRPEASAFVDSDDFPAQRALQQAIEDGEQWRIVGRPEVREDGHLRIPVQHLFS